MKNVVAYDIETTGLNLHTGAKMFSYSLSTYDGDVSVHRVDGFKNRRIKNERTLLKLFKSRTPLVMHNAKFDLTGYENYFDKKVDYNYPIHDTFIQSNLIQNDHMNHALKNLGWEIAEIPKDDEEKVKKFKNFQDVPEFIMNEYQERDVIRTMLLHRFFYPKLKENNLLEIYNMELKLQRVTMEMERRGIQLNQKACREMQTNLKDDIENSFQDMEDYCGKRLNVNRAIDVAWLLYEFEKLPIRHLTKKTKQPSVAKDTLLELRDEFKTDGIEFILKLKSWIRGITTLQGYLDEADANSILHPNIKTNGATTGRESCSNPNLQNVAKSGKLLVPYPVLARKVFRPRPGYINIHVDYAGIEARLLIHYSDDPKMINEINKANGDPHRLAAEVFYAGKFKDADKATKKVLRDAAKNANFAVPYGAGMKQTAKTLGLYGNEGLTAYERYRAEFPRYVGLYRDIGKMVREDGYIKTAFGRILHLPKDQSYMGTNYLIQGTAAGILKRAQVRVHEYLEKATGGEVKILLPIHDELIIEYPRKRLPDLRLVLKDVADLMEDFDFKIPMKVEFELATASWEHKKPFVI